MPKKRLAEPTRYGVEQSIAYVWHRLFKAREERPETSTLFLAIAEEAEACLWRADWENRVRRIENILSVIRFRMQQHWEDWHESELDKLVKAALKAKEVRIA